MTSTTHNYIMPGVLRRINRIFRRNSNDAHNDNNNNNPNGAIPIHRRNNHMNAMESDSERLNNEMNIIKFSKTGYKRQSDGSVTLSVQLDKDQVECCVCLSSMTNNIYRCRGNRSKQ
eukprot:41895_1